MEEDNRSSNTNSALTSRRQDSSNSTRASEPLLDLEGEGEEVATVAASSREVSQAMQRT